MIYEEDFDGVESIEEIEEAKANLSETIEKASTELAELEELTDGLEDLEELSEDAEENVDGGWFDVDVSWKKRTVNISGSTRGQRTSECIQTFTTRCGKVKGISLTYQSRSGLGFAKKGNYLYAVRRNGVTTGTIKGTITGSLNDANVTWTFK